MSNPRILDEWTPPALPAIRLRVRIDDEGDTLFEIQKPYSDDPEAEPQGWRPVDEMTDREVFGLLMARAYEQIANLRNEMTARRLIG